MNAPHISLSPRGSGLHLAFLFLLIGCPVQPTPGDLSMGQYVVTASSGERADECQLVEVTAEPFTFNATLTRETTSERAWITLNGYSREGTFDGQVLRSTAEANRVFAACSKCSTRVVETIDVALLSRSQNEAVRSECPANALDGGLVVDPDGGIIAPSQTLQGYDAVRLCGELTTVVVAMGLVDGGACDPQCGGCTVRYQLVGDRR